MIEVAYRAGIRLLTRVRTAPRTERIWRSCSSLVAKILGATWWQVENKAERECRYRLGITGTEKYCCLRLDGLCWRYDALGRRVREPGQSETSSHKGTRAMSRTMLRRD